MKLGVLSDIHGNVIALKACIDYMERENCDEYLLLGDFVSDTPYPVETLDLIYDLMKKHKCHILRGNREEYMLEQRKLLKSCGSLDYSFAPSYKSGSEICIPSSVWLRNSASGNLVFTYEKLRPKDWEFFDNLPITFVYEKEGYPSITCAHGSPDSSRELLQLFEDRIYTWFDKIDTDYMLCAHTHYPGELEYNGKHYFNSGSIGISINDCGLAQCLILESIEKNGSVVWEPRFLKIPYDNMQVVKDIFTSGLAKDGLWFINSNILTLLTGNDLSYKLITRAAFLQKEAGFNDRIWPDIDECYFEQAAKELGIPNYSYEDILEIEKTN